MRLNDNYYLQLYPCLHLLQVQIPSPDNNTVQGWLQTYLHRIPEIELLKDVHCPVYLQHIYLVTI